MALVDRVRETRRDFAGVLHNVSLRRLELAWLFSIVSYWAYGIADVVAAAIESVGIFAGPAVGGLLLAWTSIATTFFVTAAAVAMSAVLILRIPARAGPREASREDAVSAELLAGLHAILRDRKIA